MTKAEKLLRLLIAEAVMSSVNEAVDDADDEGESEEDETPGAKSAAAARRKEASATAKYLADREAAYKSYLSDNPEAVEKARAASAMPTVVRVPRPKREPRQYLTPGASMSPREARAKGVSSVNAPYIGMSHDHLEGLTGGAQYEAGSAAVDAYRSMMAHHNDPMTVLKTYLYADVSLLTQVPDAVPCTVIHDMVLTPAVRESLLKSSSSTPTQSAAVIPPTRPVPADAAEDFAMLMMRAYEKISQMREDSVDDDTFIGAADQILNGAHPSIKAALESAGRVLVPSADKSDRVVLVERIRTQSNSLRPFMKQADEAVRKIRRVAGGTIKEVGTQTQKTRDPRTGFEKETTFVTGMRDRDVTGSIIIPRSLLGYDEEKDEGVSDLENGVLMHMANTKFRLTQARGYYNVARASYLLSLRERVEAYYKNTGNERVLEGIAPVFDHLTEVLEAHPYSRLGIKDVQTARRALERAMSGESLREGSATITLGDSHLKQARTMSDFISKSTLTPDAKDAIVKPLNDFINAASAGEPISAQTLSLINDWISTSRSMLNRGKVNVSDLADALDMALEEEAEAYAVVPEGGASEVKQSSTPPAVGAQMIAEGNEEDNRRLEEAINIMVSNEQAALAALSLAYTTEQESTVPAGAAGGKDGRRRFRSALKKNLATSKKHVASLIEQALKLSKSLAETVDQATLSLKAQVDKIKADQKEAYRQGYSIIDKSSVNERRQAAIRAALEGAYKSMKLPPTIGEMIERRIETARSLRCEERPSQLFMTVKNQVSGAVQLIVESKAAEDHENIAPTDTGSLYAIPMGPVFGETNLESARAQKYRRDFLIELAAKTNPIYELQLGSAVLPGQTVVIPSMMRTPTTYSAADTRLTLGIGRVVHRDIVSVTMTSPIISAQSADVRPALKQGRMINLMTVTVAFGPGQWRLGSKSFDTAEKDEKEKRLAIQIDNFEKGANLDARTRAEMRKNILELQRELKTSYPGTTAAVRSALTSLDSSLDASFVNSAVSVDEAKGVLTLSMLAPAFLDLPGKHETQRAMFNWDLNSDPPVYDQSKEAVQTLVTSTHRGVVYLPASSVQMKPEHETDLDSPFNVNQPQKSVSYRVGTGAKRTSVGFDPASFVLEDFSKERLAHVGRLRLRVGKKAIISGEADTDATATGTFPITVRVPTSDDPAAEGVVQSIIESDSSFSRDYYLVSSRSHTSPAKYERDPLTGRSKRVQDEQETGDTLLVYELRAGRRDPKNRISQLAVAGGTVGVGDMVYIDPMYQVTTAAGTELNRGSFVAANKSSPPELYGVGKVTKIYFHGTAGGEKSLSDVPNRKGVFQFNPAYPNEFRALLADIEFRGDQVKQHGVRGSLFSPNVSLNGVGVMFLKSLPKSMDTNTRKFEAFDPDRGVSRGPNGELDVNYPNAPLTNNVIYTAGWDMLSPHDRDNPVLKTASSGDGELIVGSSVQIIQPSHPMVGAIGELTGFVGASQLTQGQLASIRSGGMSPAPVNAIVSITGADLMAGVHSIIASLAREITGKPFSTGAIYQLFRHIDREITKRYIRNPKKASGYLAYDSGRWSGAFGSNIPVHDIIGTRVMTTPDGARGAMPEHGAGAWKSFHDSGHAVHPGGAEFGKLTNKSRKMETIDRPGAKNTLYGCNAILKAILEHGPEKSMTAEESYEAERQQLTSSESANIAGTYDKTARNPYPAGHHTEEAIYFLHLKTRWIMAGGGKSGRSTEGAKSGYVGYATSRVGSPVGTSFRFQLNPNEVGADPDYAGLEYTMLLRQEMRSITVRIDKALKDIDECIARAQGSKHIDPQVVNEARDIRKGLKERILDSINSSLSFITHLGHTDENGRTRNTVDVWHEATDELERKHSNKIKHEFSDRIRDELDSIMQNVQTIHTLVDSEGEKIFGAAVVPTAQTTTVEPDGQIVITFSRPKPVYSASARSEWARTQIDAVKSVGEILGSQLVTVFGDPSNPANVVKLNNKGYFDGAIRSMEQTLAERKSSQIDNESSLHSWESDILSHPTLGSILRQDYIDSVLALRHRAASEANPASADRFDFSPINLDDPVFSLMTLAQFESSLRTSDARYRAMYEDASRMIKDVQAAFSAQTGRRLETFSPSSIVREFELADTKDASGNITKGVLKTSGGATGTDSALVAFVSFLTSPPKDVKVVTDLEQNNKQIVRALEDLKKYLTQKHDEYLAPHSNELLAVYDQLLRINAAEHSSGDYTDKGDIKGYTWNPRKSVVGKDLADIQLAMASSKKAKKLLGMIKPNFTSSDLWSQATQASQQRRQDLDADRSAYLQHINGHYALIVGESMIPETEANFCRVSFKYENDFVAAEERFFSMLREFVSGEGGLGGYVDSIISTLKSAEGDEEVDAAAIGKVSRQLTRYHGMLTVNSAEDWIASNDTAVKNDGMTPDIAARRAAEMAHAAESGFRDIANIIDDGFILTRGASTDPRTRSRVEELHAKIEDARLSNERHTLEFMQQFPADSGLQDVLDEMNSLYQRSMTSRQDQVCVPIRTTQSLDTTPLLRARLKTKISGNALDVVLEAVSPI